MILLSLTSTTYAMPPKLCFLGLVLFFITRQVDTQLPILYHQLYIFRNLRFTIFKAEFSSILTKCSFSFPPKEYQIRHVIQKICNQC